MYSNLNGPAVDYFFETKGETNMIKPLSLKADCL